MNDAQRIMMYDASKKSVAAAYLLWFFLGFFGAHRFYLGKVGSAIGMLVLTLLSIPLAIILVGFLTWAAVGLWWLVDAFLVPGMIREHNVRLAAAYGG